jgi:hypothetical protein
MTHTPNLAHAERCHTPGPWRRRREWNACDEIWIDPDETAPDGTNSDRSIACCYGSDCEANSSLIATAPDLLDALQCMLYFFEGFADVHGFTPQAIAEMEPVVQARAAIARVEGAI